YRNVSGVQPCALPICTADLEAADIPAPQVVAAARALVPDVARGIRSAPLTVEECAEAVREALGPTQDTAAAGLRLDTAAAGGDRSEERRGGAARWTGW